ncbi:RNA polymerase sigma factor (sigma-70 family) [Kibdelosporangium banguiense]|uniref:RNA polymerase sigma factor SigS n=1 Tax=Kibdelosporangium banguiense TaxID=1365924 RepID=A0ABS4TE08_9PSEU|nr:RNA polymerase sigma factor (sigma-70 family) [Kibdelosporangium banguiense]
MLSIDGEDVSSSPSGVAQDPPRFEEFYTRTFPLLVNFVRRRNLSTACSAEDIASEVMSTVWEAWRRLSVRADEDKEHVYKRTRKYAFGVAKNKIIDARREALRYQGVGHGGPMRLDYLAVNSTAPKTALLDAIQTSIVLTSQQRRVLELYLLGYSTAEISKGLRVKESTVRTHLASARNVIREVLQSDRVGTDEQSLQLEQSSIAKRRKFNFDLRAIIATLLALFTLAGATFTVQNVTLSQPANQPERLPTLPTDFGTPSPGTSQGSVPNGESQLQPRTSDTEEHGSRTRSTSERGQEPTSIITSKTTPSNAHSSSPSNSQSSSPYPSSPSTLPENKEGIIDILLDTLGLKSSVPTTR